jgi:3-oxoacyl-[acyl-carrier protein] reductase
MSDWGAYEAQVWGVSLEEARKRLINQIPLRRTGTVEDVANLVVFLASDRASYITGQTINVCGGRVLN